MKKKSDKGFWITLAFIIMWALIVALIAIAPYLIILHFVIKYW